MINETVNVNQHFLTNMRFLGRTCFEYLLFFTISVLQRKSLTLSLH